jgi:hypothetical protein
MPFESKPSDSIKIKRLIKIYNFMLSLLIKGFVAVLVFKLIMVLAKNK